MSFAARQTIKMKPGKNDQQTQAASSGHVVFNYLATDVPLTPNLVFVLASHVYIFYKSTKSRFGVNGTSVSKQFLT